jgi:hypothetical protein
LDGTPEGCSAGVWKSPRLAFAGKHIAQFCGAQSLGIAYRPLGYTAIGKGPDLSERWERRVLLFLV